MNGADPYSALHQQQQAVGSGNATMAGSGLGGTVAPPPSQTPGAAAAAAAEQRAAAGATASADQCAATRFPILEKHIKPLVGSDTAKAVRYDGDVAVWLDSIQSVEDARRKRRGRLGEYLEQHHTFQLAT